jgi:hypothetical protein
LNLCNMYGASRGAFWTGLPDFSWHNIPKRGEIYQITKTSPNVHKIYQVKMSVRFLHFKMNVFNFLKCFPHFSLTKNYPH